MQMNELREMNGRLMCSGRICLTQAYESGLFQLQVTEIDIFGSHNYEEYCGTVQD